MFKRLPRHHLVIYGLYLLVAIIITWPALPQLGTHFMGGSTSDAYEMGHHIWWFKYALQTGEPLFYQSMLGYPEGIAGVTLWANPLQFFPAWVLAFVMPVVSAYNLTILLTMGLNGWAFYILANHLLNHRPRAAWIAGLVFMTFPTFQGHLFDGHAGLMVMWPVPVYIYALFQLVNTARRRWLLLAALFFVLSPGGHMLQAIYVLAPVTGLFLLGRLWLRDWQGMRRVLVAALLGSLGLMVFILPVLNETLQTTAYTDTGGYVRFSADILGIISPSFEHPLFGRILDYPRQVLGVNLAEGSSYIGVIAGLLALLGLAGRRAARWWLLLGLVAWVLSLGPLLKILDSPATLQVDGYSSYITLPWAAVQNLPGFDLARTPGRFTFTLAIAVAMLAGFGAAVLWQRNDSALTRIRSWLPVIFISGLIVFDYQFFWPLPSMPAAVPDAISDLRDRDEVTAVFNLPWDNLLAAKDSLYLQTWHEKPLIAGQVSRETPVDPAKLSTLQDTLDPALLNEAGASVVILHKARAEATGQLNTLMARSQRQLGAPFYEDERLALFNVPSTDESPQFTLANQPAGVTGSQWNSYLYLAEPGWVTVSGQLNASNREVNLLLNGDVLHRWSLTGPTAINLALPVARPGYQTVSFALDPPCPTIPSSVLQCQTLTLDGLAYQPQTSGPLYEPVIFSGGIELSAAETLESQDGVLNVWLWWQFDEPRSDVHDIRFVHLLGETGPPPQQNDQSPGNLPADSQWAEVIQFDTTTLTPGEYRVLVGWYTIPDVVRYDVLTDVPGAVDDTVEIGRITIE